MNTPINKDFDKYKDDFFKGLTLRETLWAAGALAVGFVCMLLFIYYLKWNTYIATLATMPFVMLIGFNGFFNKNGMTLYQYAGKKIKIIFGQTLVLRGENIRLHKIREAEELMKTVKEKNKEKKNGKIQRV